MSVILRDTFTRADSAATMGSTESAGANATATWTPHGANPWGISANRAHRVGGGFGADWATVDIGGADHLVEARISSVGTSYPGLIARFVDANNYALCNFDGSGDFLLYKIVAGAFTLVGNAGAWADGDLLTLRCEGTTWTVLRNGGQVLQAVVTDLATGTRCGFLGVESTTRFDDFRAAAPPGASLVTPRVARWSFVIADTAGGPLGELTSARTRRLSVSLDGSAEASWTMSGRHAQAVLVEEMLTDLVVYRGTDKLFRGRVGPSQDDVGSARHTAQFTAHDYRALLERRTLYDSDVLVFAAVDQAAIAWQLIANTQARPGGNAGVTRGTGQATGILRDRTYEPGKSVGEALADMGRVSQGFEWEVDAELAFNVFYPTRGADNGFVADYGGTVVSAQRTVNPSTYANAGRLTGEEALAPAEWAVDDIATRAEGRWDLSEGFTDVVEAATLTAKAKWSKANRSVLTPAWVVVLRPGRWSGPDELWLGDSVTLVVRSGRLDVHQILRVLQLDFAVSENGSETVSVTLGHPVPSLGQRLRAVASRLTDLERR